MERLVMHVREGLSAATVQGLIERIEEAGHTAKKRCSKNQTIIEVRGDSVGDLVAEYRSWPEVAAVHPENQELLLAGRFARGGSSEINVSGVTVGGREIAVIAGPCSMDDPESLLETAAAVQASGAAMLRVGLFKPRTSPYSFQGVGREGFQCALEVRRRYGLPIVTEIMGVNDLDDLLEVADVLQVGARNMQNFPLLTELGKAQRPVLLKRGFGATIKEWLSAAEYLLTNGNEEVILCERGIRTFEPSTRFTVDINAIPVAKELTHLPIIVDPSHGTGHARYVQAIAGACVAAGADGVMVEVHSRPGQALSDRAQALDPASFSTLMAYLQKISTAVGRDLMLAPRLAAPRR